MSHKITARKVRMCVGKDSSCYSRDGRYFGQGTSNYDVECETCGVSRTFGAHSRKEAIERFMKNEPFHFCDIPCPNCK